LNRVFVLSRYDHFYLHPKPHPDMSTTRGIFQSFLNPSGIRTDSSVTPAAEAATSPFTAVALQGSAVTVESEAGDSQKAESPFQAVELPESFGFEAPPKSLAAGLSAAQSISPAFASTPTTAPALGDSPTDSFSIRQLELRAIFGVDHEMSPKEIFERCRALKGIQNIAWVNAEDMATIEALKNLLPNLGFGGSVLKLYADSVPLEFIREGSVLLAVQTDGGFAPGVRETLMLVAREFGRLS
jgi:hypothetical protein